MSNNDWEGFERDLAESPEPAEVGSRERDPAGRFTSQGLGPGPASGATLDSAYPVPKWERPDPPAAYRPDPAIECIAPALTHSKWIGRFLQLASLVASWSKDPTTQVGAVASDPTNQVLETGYNGPPKGVEDLEPRFQRPAKYLWTTHAEANLVAAAAKHRLGGSTVYVTHLCCAQCAALLINSGVSRVVCGAGLTSMAPEQFEVALRMFEEAGVQLDLPAGSDASYPWGESN